MEIIAVNGRKYPNDVIHDVIKHAMNNFSVSVEYHDGERDTTKPDLLSPVITLSQNRHCNLNKT